MPALTRKQIVDETIDYFAVSPAGMDGEEPVYRSPTGVMCAVGRCLDHDRVPPDGLWGEVGDVCDNDPDQLDQLLRAPYRGHDLDFWRGLQCLHDNRELWFPNHLGGHSLTARGQLIATRIVAGEPDPFDESIFAKERMQ